MFNRNTESRQKQNVSTNESHNETIWQHSATYKKQKTTADKLRAKKKLRKNHGNVQTINYKPLCSISMLNNFVHRNAHVAFFINTTPILDHQYLGGLMRNSKHVDDLI